jgi:hypothetical protein
MTTFEFFQFFSSCVFCNKNIKLAGSNFFKRIFLGILEIGLTKQLLSFLLFVFYFFSRVARWFIFKPKIQIWVNFLGLWNGKCLYVYWSFGKLTAIWYFLGPIDNLVVIWYILPRFGILCQEKSGNPVLLHKDLIRDFLLYVCCHQ